MQCLINGEALHNSRALSSMHSINSLFMKHSRSLRFCKSNISISQWYSFACEEYTVSSGTQSEGNLDAAIPALFTSLNQRHSSGDIVLPDAVSAVRTSEYSAGTPGRHVRTPDEVS